MSAKPKPHQCPECLKNAAQLDALIKRLDCRRSAEGSLVMWPEADMRWYAVNVEVAGLLNREAETMEISLLLHQAGIRDGGNIVGAVRRLIEKMWKAKMKKEDK